MPTPTTVLNFKTPSEADTHWALRATFDCGAPAEITVECAGAGWYEIRLDGAFLMEGPPRCDAARPESRFVTANAAAGRHCISVHLHDMRVDTRLMLASVPPFFAVSVRRDGGALPLSWKASRLEGYRRTGRRLGCVLGWVEWEDTRRNPENWRLTDFDDSAWSAAPGCGLPDGIGEPFCGGREEMGYFTSPLKPLAEGRLVNMSMVEHDPPMNFVFRDLAAADPDMPPNGYRWLFDLGLVKLGRPRIELDAPPGALVQIAWSEALTNGRVYPYLSSGGGSDSCMLDTWVARGGRQVFQPLHPKGGRFLEVHVLAAPEAVRWISGEFTERCYYPETPEGEFECGDALLDKIWRVGVDTLRGCAEDAITDNPSRERGQWLGDAIGPGMEILACSYSDHRPLVRGLRQAAECAREDGLIPAIFPGTRQFIPSFAIQWVAAIPRYFRLSGDRKLLADLLPAARATVAFFEADRVAGGLRMNPAHWNFIDWGYQGAATEFAEGARDAAELDPALSVFYFSALRALDEWERLLGLAPGGHGAAAAALAEEIHATWLARHRPETGFHASVLALAAGLVDETSRGACVAAIKRHICDCFPMNPDAPRLESVHVESPRLITPFFMHFALPALAENGQAEFVYDVIRRCWGWMLRRGMTTWYEVFDPRWSHCHQWSGCPTWILSRYALGIRPRFDKAANAFELDIHPGNLTRAKGRHPLPGGGLVHVEWRMAGGGSADVSIRSDRPVRFEERGGRTIFEGFSWSGGMPLHAAAGRDTAPEIS